jgi:hypothetical protein
MIYIAILRSSAPKLWGLLRLSSVAFEPMSNSAAPFDRTTDYPATPTTTWLTCSFTLNTSKRNSHSVGRRCCLFSGSSGCLARTLRNVDGATFQKQIQWMTKAAFPHWSCRTINHVNGQGQQWFERQHTIWLSVLKVINVQVKIESCEQVLEKQSCTVQLRIPCATNGERGEQVEGERVWHFASNVTLCVCVCARGVQFSGRPGMHAACTRLCMCVRTQP